MVEIDPTFADAADFALEFSANPTTTTIPEPPTWTLVILGLGMATFSANAPPVQFLARGDEDGCGGLASGGGGGIMIRGAPRSLGLFMLAWASMAASANAQGLAKQQQEQALKEITQATEVICYTVQQQGQEAALNFRVRLTPRKRSYRASCRSWRQG